MLFLLPGTSQLGLAVFPSAEGGVGHGGSRGALRLQGAGMGWWQLALQWQPCHLVVWQGQLSCHPELPAEGEVG